MSKETRPMPGGRGKGFAPTKGMKFKKGTIKRLLSYVAETERSFIRQRQAEGIAIARENGTRFGRPRRERPEEFARLKIEWENDRISARKAGALLGISHNTFLKWAREEK